MIHASDNPIMTILPSTRRMIVTIAVLLSPPPAGSIIENKNPVLLERSMDTEGRMDRSSNHDCLKTWLLLLMKAPMTSRAYVSSSPISFFTLSSLDPSSHEGFKAALCVQSLGLTPRFLHDAHMRSTLRRTNSRSMTGSLSVINRLK